MSFYDEVLINLPLFNSPDRVSSLDYLEPITRQAVINIMADSSSQGMPLLVFETYRSESRQRLLYQQGSTQLEDVGVHGFGLACDLVKDVNGEPSWKGNFDFLEVLAQKHGLISGLTWGLTKVSVGGWIDPCHVQRIRVQDQIKLFDAKWYPDSSYNPYTMFA